MRKIKTKYILRVLAYSLFFSFLSCKSDTKTIHITEFTQPIRDSLFIIDNTRDFSTYRIEVNGVVNDTCLIYPYEQNFGFKINGKIDTSFVMDYYGGYNLPFNFEPYKATKGNLKITLRAL